MLTPQDVRAAQFEKNIRGYRTEEVDRFLDKVEEQLKQDEDQAEELRRQIAELTAENQRLHKEMESYEADGSETQHGYGTGSAHRTDRKSVV